MVGGVDTRSPSVSARTMSTQPNLAVWVAVECTVSPSGLGQRCDPSPAHPTGGLARGSLRRPRRLSHTPGWFSDLAIVRLTVAGQCRACTGLPTSGALG